MSFKEAIEFVMAHIQHKPTHQFDLYETFYDDIATINKQSFNALSLAVIKQSLLNNTHNFTHNTMRVLILKVAYNLINKIDTSDRHQIIHSNLKLYDINTLVNKYDFYFMGKITKTLRTTQNTGYTTLALLPNNKFVTVVNKEVTISNLTDIEFTFKIHAITNYIAVLPNNRIFISNDDNQSTIWNLHTKKQEPAPFISLYTPHSIDIFPNGNLAIPSYANTFEIWDTSKVIDSFEINTIHDKPVTAIRILKNGKIAVAVSFIEIWDLTTKSIDFVLGHEEETNLINTLEQLSNHRLLSVSTYSIKVWDLKTQDTISAPEEKDVYIVASLLIQEERLIAAYSDYTVKVWDLRTLKILAQQKFNVGLIAYIKQFPNGDILIGSKDGIIAVWNYCEIRYNLTNYDHICGLEILPDGRVLLALHDGIVHIIA